MAQYEHERSFMEAEEMQNFLTELISSDIYSENLVCEGKVVELPPVPILTGSVMSNIKVDNYTTVKIDPTPENEEAVAEAMATTNIVWAGPVSGKLTAVPVSEIAIPSLSARAGLYGPSIKKKPLILNEGFELYPETRAKTLVRNGSLIASHSAKYEWLKQDELFTILTTSLIDQFGKYVFVKGYYSDSITEAMFSLPTVKASFTAYVSKARKTGDVVDVTPAVGFYTSDVAESGANLLPVMNIDGVDVLIGEPLKLSHDNKHTAADFAKNCDDILACLKNGVSRLEKLMDITLLYPENVFQNIVKQFRLPVTASSKAFEDFCLQRGNEVTAHALYLSLYGIIGYLNEEGASVAKRMDVEASICRVLYTDIKKLDTAILQ